MTRPTTVALRLLVLAVLTGAMAFSVERAFAVFTDGPSVPGNTLATDTLDPPTAVQTAPCGSSIAVGWTPTVDTYASGYRVLRSTTMGGPYSQVAEVTPGTTTNYDDSPADGTYYYVGRAFYQNWESLDSNEASATTPAGCLNLQGNDTEMSTATSPTGVVDTHDGVTDYFTATSPITSANNDTDWTLVLVLKDKPNVAAPATITAWWQNGGACSGGSVPGQIFATGSVTVPIAVDNVGHSFTVPKVGGTVTHTFVSGDLLCMSLENTGTINDQDIHAHANIASTSGTTGVSRLSGPFVQDTLLDPPTSVAAATGASAGTIDLSWTVTVDTYADGYHVLRGTAAGGPYVQIAEVTPQSATSYQDTGADCGTYYYVLRSFHSAYGESPDSNEASAASLAGTGCALNLQANDTDMSTATSPAGTIDTNDGATDYFTATSPITSATNDTDWTLVLVLEDKPDAAAPATITVWWQNGGACSGGSVPGQIFATASVTVPIAVDKAGTSLTVTKVGGTVSHTFVGGDLLCMSLANTGTGGSQDIHSYANTASTSGTTGVSRLIGSFVKDTLLDPPTSVAAATGASAGTIDLSWTATVDTYADGYHVLRSTTAGGPYIQIAEVTPQSATSYQDTSADCQTYYYVLRSFHSAYGESADSNEASAAAPSGTACALNLQANDVVMSTATSPAGTIDTNDGATDYFTTPSPITSATNDTDWTLVLVLEDKPNVAAPATITVWWQNGGACTGGSVPGQIFATASVTVPIAVDKAGVSLTVTKVGGTVSHTFVSGDLLCMSLANTGTINDQDIHSYANTASTSGTTGVSRLIGSFVH